MTQQRTVRIAFALGIALLLPSLATGFLLDDYVHGYMLRETVDGSPMKTFVFSDGDPEHVAAACARGWFPWWTAPELKFAFLRPLSSTLLRLDFSWFGDTAWPHHAHSLLWWTALLAVTVALLRASVPGAVGALAVLLFAMDSSHVWPAAWISNRNALVAALPAFAGLLAHVRWREGARVPGWFLGPAGLAVGLLGGEIALCVAGYFVAYEIVGSRDPAALRARSMAPIVTLVGAYAILYRSLGYGTAGSGFYFDPASDPIGFLTAAATRLPSLLAGAILGLSPDVLVIAPGLLPVVVGAGIVGTILLALAVRTVRAELEPGTRRGVDWLIAGAALSVIPVLATEPADRLFLVPSVGLSAALAAILVRGWSSWKQPSGVSPLRRWSLVGLSGTLAVVHLVLSPVQVLTTQVAIAVQSRRAEQAARLADLGPGGEDGPDVVVVSAPDFVAGRYLPVQRWHLGLSVPRSWHVLSLAPHDHRLTRTDASSLELEVLDGEMMTTVFEKLYRPPRPFLRPGDRFAHGPLKVEILRVRPGGGPDRVSYRFDRNLDDPSLFVIGWQGGAFRRLALPEVGGTMVLPRGVGPVGF